MLETLVLCEARADYEIATQLAQRVLKERGPEWLADSLEFVLGWRGIRQGTPFTAWKNVKQEMAGFKLPRYRDHGKSGPKKHDSALARKAVVLAHQLQGRGEERLALLLVRDLDSRPDRLEGLEQAREDARHANLAMILATPDPEREAWVLNGFVTSNAAEEERLRKETKQLGFDPCRQAHRLRGDVRRGQDERDIKKLLDRLTGDRERERACWEVTPLDLLEERGEASRLAAYLQEIETRLLPLLTRPSSGATSSR